MGARSAVTGRSVWVALFATLFLACQGRDEPFAPPPQSVLLWFQLAAPPHFAVLDLTVTGVGQRRVLLSEGLGADTFSIRADELTVIQAWAISLSATDTLYAETTMTFTPHRVYDVGFLFHPRNTDMPAVLSFGSGDLFPSITAPDSTMIRGDSMELELRITGDTIPASAHPQWLSRQPAVATVDARGVVTARGPGRTRIMALLAGRTALWDVRVADPAPTLPVSSFAAGESHSCYVAAGGAAFCWGSNARGQLGVPGAGEASAAPVAVAGGLALTAITTGQQHTCGLTGTGEAYCWGDNTSGQLGIGSTVSAAVPTPVAGGLLFTSLAAGWAHTCGVAFSGDAWCWGSAVAGRLGNLFWTGTWTAPTPVAGGLLFRQVVAGKVHTCGLATDGTAYCWGQGYQLGAGPSVTAANAPYPVTGGLKFAVLAAGSGHSCGLTPQGRGYCWGGNSSYVLGDGTGIAYRHTPTEIWGSRSWQALAPGYHHSCAITSDGVAMCWGPNDAGQLGDGTVSVRAWPTAVQGGVQLVALAAGGWHTCGATAEGQLYCWGQNASGQVGDGTGGPATLQPQRVTGAPPLSAVAAAGQHTCGLTALGAAWCWGEGESGQIGDGAGVDRLVPALAPASEAFTRLSAYGGATCGLAASGAAYCWGSNTSGQLGIGTRDNSLYPRRVLDTLGFVDLSLGSSHACGSVRPGAAYCWGYTQHGELGMDSVPNWAWVLPTPQRVVGGYKFARVASGSAHSCALTTDTLLYCWGANAERQLGVPGASWRVWAPLAVTSAPTFIELTAGESHSCGLTPAGEAWCWGSGGAVGAGTPSGSAVPTRVTGVAAFVELRAGLNHTCGLTSAGAATCWGANAAGQLGTGDTLSSGVPVAAASGRAFRTLGTGNAHTCGVATSGDTFCWGDNRYGQLGRGVRSYATLPTAVAMP